MMTQLKIRDCTATFQASYVSARPLELFDPASIAVSIVEQLSAYNLRASDVTLDAGDGLFGYNLRAKLFSDLMNINVSATRLECVFTRLTRRADREIAHQCVHRALTACGEGLSQNCFIDVGVHAAFSSEAERNEFFSRAKPDSFLWGGMLGYQQIGEAGELLRIEVDQSWMYTESAYIHWQTFGLRLEEFRKAQEVWNSLFDTVAVWDLELIDEPSV
ncbi:MAG: hypothetical protein H0X73_06355 [Chthoniobacterales bacterium]|nr:hypothetical protein [Chthoniobacterales bacterium]